MDITPVFTVLPASEEVAIAPVVGDTLSQPVGGFMTSPNGLTQGQVTFNATGEQILIGAATAPMTGIGVFMGNDGQSTGYDFRVGDPSGHYIWWDASAQTLSIVGAVSASSINIPDTTTANSFHVDSSGNTWWGANVANGITFANASIDNQGHAIFKSVSIGGTAVQYIITNSGIFSYGDGSDGAATLDGATQQTWAANYAVNISLPTKPPNGNLGDTLIITINGTPVTMTFDSALFAAPGHVFIGASAATCIANVLDLLQNPSVTNSNHRALSTGDQALVNLFSWSSPTSTTILGTAIAPVTSVSVSTTVTAGSGSASITNTYTLVRDIYLTNLTINTGITLLPSGWRIFGTGTFTMNGTATISRNGNNGGNGAPSSGPGGGAGAGAAAVADGYLKGSPAGGNGGGGNQGPPAVPTIANSIGVAGLGSTGAITPSNVKLIANWHLATLLDISSSGSTVKFTGSNSSEGGGGSGSPVFAGGGGGASAGAIIAIYFRSIIIGASAIIQSNGGVGGNGGGDPSSRPNADGGNGGSGGVIVLVYNQLSILGTVQATGGLGGAAGPVLAPGGGVNGQNGNGGLIYEFQLSL